MTHTALPTPSSSASSSNSASGSASRSSSHSATTSASATISTGASPSHTPSSSYVPPPPAVISPELTVLGADLTGLSDGDLADAILHLRETYACALGVDVSTVKLNYTVDVGTGVPHQWSNDDAGNLLPAAPGACDAPTRRRLQGLQAQQLQRNLQAPAVGTIAWANIYLFPQANPAPGSDPAALLYARAVALTATLNALIADVTANGTAAVGNPLLASEENLSIVLGSLLEMNPATLFAGISNAPALLLTPAPVTPDNGGHSSSGITGPQIVGVVIGVISGEWGEMAVMGREDGMPWGRRCVDVCV